MAQQLQGVTDGSPPPTVSFSTPGEVVFSKPEHSAVPQSSGYKSKTAKILGSVQMIIGVVCIIFQCAVIGISITGYSSIGHGIWCGTIFFVSGLLQVISGRNTPKTCPIIATLVMSIIAVCATTIIFAFSVVDAMQYCYRRYYYREYYYYNIYVCESIVALNSVMAILSVIEALIAIITSVFCCKALQQHNDSDSVHELATQQPTNVTNTSESGSEVPLPSVYPTAPGIGESNGLINNKQTNSLLSYQPENYENVNPIYEHENQRFMKMQNVPGNGVPVLPVSQTPANPTLPPHFQQYPTAPNIGETNRNISLVYGHGNQQILNVSNLPGNGVPFQYAAQAPTNPILLPPPQHYPRVPNAAETYDRYGNHLPSYEPLNSKNNFYPVYTHGSHMSIPNGPGYGQSVPPVPQTPAYPTFSPAYHQYPTAPGAADSNYNYTNPLSSYESSNSKQNVNPVYVHANQQHINGPNISGNGVQIPYAAQNYENPALTPPFQQYSVAPSTIEVNDRFANHVSSYEPPNSRHINPAYVHDNQQYMNIPNDPGNGVPVPSVPQSPTNPAFPPSFQQYPTTPR